MVAVVVVVVIIVAPHRPFLHQKDLLLGASGKKRIERERERASKIDMLLG